MKWLQPVRIGKPNPGVLVADLCNQAQAELFFSSKHMGRPNPNSKPGDFILKQSIEIRDVLKTLKSEDMLNLRLEPWEIKGINK